MKKTILDYLKELPVHFKSKAIYNLENHGIEGPDVEVSSMNEALSRGFHWHFSPEESDFWGRVSACYDKVGFNEFIYAYHFGGSEEIEFDPSSIDPKSDQVTISKDDFIVMNISHLSAKIMRSRLDDIDGSNTITISIKRMNELLDIERSSKKS